MVQFESFADYLNYHMTDPRTKGWFLVDSPVPTITGVALYLCMVWIGPKIMKNRKPFQLNGILVPYNLLMAALNLFICLRLTVAAFNLRYNLFCQPCRQIWSQDELTMANGVWWYYFSKCLEFMDTLFFILRKKDKQLSFLHIYHHSTMFFFWWIGIKFVPTGSTFLPAVVNSFIHVVMYSYYGLAAIGPHMQPYLWWKRYLTILQLYQFSGALILGINAIVNGCDFPKWMQYTLCGYMSSFLVLFGQFYVKEYYNDHQKRKQEKLIENNNNNTIKDQNHNTVQTKKDE
ncbi:unnamed protein product [Diamesa serratosioi]